MLLKVLTRQRFYVLTESTDGGIQVNLIAAETKVASMKGLPLPRLELCAAFLLTKLLKLVSMSVLFPVDGMLV